MVSVTVGVTMATEEDQTRQEVEEVREENAEDEKGLEDIRNVVKEWISLRAACVGVLWPG